MNLSVEQAATLSSVLNFPKKRFVNEDSNIIYVKRKKSKKLDINDKWEVVSNISYYLGKSGLSSTCKNPGSSIFSFVSKNFNYSISTVKRIWKDYYSQLKSNTETSPNLCPKSSSGRPSLLDSIKENVIIDEHCRNDYDNTYRGLSASLRKNRKLSVPKFS